jgi:FkbM family methyltransferase
MENGHTAANSGSLTALLLLQRFSALARSLGLRSALFTVAGAVDWIAIRIGIFPLSVSAEGSTFWGFFRHWPFLRKLARLDYEGASRRIFETAVIPGAVVVDGGAHIGVYSVLAAKRCGSSGTVYSYEPDPYNFAALALNLRRNGCANVHAMRQALADRSGTTTFYQARSSVSGSTVARLSRGPQRPTTVDSAALDDVLTQAPIGRLVAKLDLEGGELSALAGMRRALSESAAVLLLVEANPGALAESAGSLESLVGDIRSCGLQVQAIDERSGRLGPVPKVLVETINLCCTRGIELPQAGDGRRT